ncbi:MAG TPA: hypothetical protein PKE63_04335 [Lacibacter sp.]|nr:hypothetical protein [Lacibacter sp.]HMO89186.1 hypothetical protein [Lacibacter sp.]HMP86479.1 hypothetical protein [Lacibacter sp.]
MLETLLYGLVAIFLMLYALRTLLMVGYEHIKYKAGAEKNRRMLQDYIRKFFSLKPLIQQRLEPRGYDFKLYKRFQLKYNLYYAGLWVSLFLILFLTARVYLQAF